MNDEVGVLFDSEGGHARITLNRPAVHNALGRSDMIAMVEFIMRLNQDRGLRSILLTGNGEKTFCSGASLTNAEGGSIQTSDFVLLTEALSSAKAPTICSLNGNVFGGGVELALCCDLVIGLKGSRAFVPPAKLGLCYDVSGLQRYVAKIGLAAAKRLLLSNETFNDEELLRVGVYDYLVAREERESFHNEIIERFGGLAPLAVRNMKQTLNDIALGKLNVEIARQREQECFNSEDLKIGLKSHANKQKPDFIGE